MTLKHKTMLMTAAGLVMMGTLVGHAATPQAPKTEATRVKRGEYLVRIMGCNDCHTPHKLGPKGPEPDLSRSLSGHPQDVAMPPAPAASGPWIAHVSGTMTAWAGPWGISFPANLTPDKETGLGDWTEEMFLATMRTGRDKGKGRMILPPMPISSLQALTDQDLKDLFLYLRTVPAVRNKVPTPIEPAE